MFNVSKLKVENVTINKSTDQNETEFFFNKQVGLRSLHALFVWAIFPAIFSSALNSN